MMRFGCKPCKTFNLCQLGIYHYLLDRTFQANLAGCGTQVHLATADKMGALHADTYWEIWTACPPTSIPRLLTRLTNVRFLKHNWCVTCGSGPFLISKKLQKPCFLEISWSCDFPCETLSDIMGGQYCTISTDRSRFWENFHPRWPINFLLI